MKVQKESKNQAVDYKELKSCLTKYCSCIEQLTKLLHNSNIVGTYSEILVCNVLGLEKEPDSHIWTDAKGEDGATYQIKSRWNKSFLHEKSGQNEFGSFDYCENEYPFNHLILVYYDGDLLKPKVFKIPSSEINLLIGTGARRKGNRVIFRYNASFKKIVEQKSHICDISNQFDDIFV